MSAERLVYIQAVVEMACVGVALDGLLLVRCSYWYQLYKMMLEQSFDPIAALVPSQSSILSRRVYSPGLVNALGQCTSVHLMH
jgi:hypothetical protein